MLTRRIVALAALVVGAQATRLGAQAPSLADSIRALESQRAQALMKADTVALSPLVADEFVEISRLGTLRTKADNMREIANGTLRLTTVRYDSLSVRIYGDVAVLQGIADNTGTMRGFPFSGKIRYTRIFVRRDGRWRAVAMQHTSMQ
jgi:ketosteroid isomerase-like protein